MPQLYLFSVDKVKQSSTVQSSSHPAVLAAAGGRTAARWEDGHTLNMVLLCGLQAVSEGEDLYRDVHSERTSAYGRSVVLWIFSLPGNYMYL